MTIHIGLLQVNIFLADAQSLKDKRMVLKSLKDRIRNQFNVSVAELDQQDKWQTATVGFVMVGNDHRYIDQALQHVLSFIESLGTVEICDHQIEHF